MAGNCNKSYSKVKETETNLRVLKLKEQISEWISVASNKDIVAFFGLTQSGKSTFTYCLAGNEVVGVRDKPTGDIFLMKTSDSIGPAIGHPAKGKSVTEEPQFCGKVPGTDFLMVDFAGYCDNKGTLQQVKNAVSYKTILCKQNSVRFVLVVTFDVIKANDPLPFYKLLYELHKISPKIADNLCVVCTRGPRNSSVEALLERALEKCSQFLKEDKGIADIAELSQMMLQTIIMNKGYFDFWAPENEGNFTLQNINEFVTCIKNRPGMKVSEFPLQISPEAQNEISALYDFSYEAVEKDVNYAASAILNNVDTNIGTINQMGDNSEIQSAIAKFACFKSEKTKLDNLVEASTFEDLFANAEKIGVTIQNSFPDNIKAYVFMEELRDMYKIEKGAKRGESEFLLNLKNALRLGTEKYNCEIVVSKAASEKEIEEKKRKDEALQKEVETSKKKADAAEKEAGKYKHSKIVMGAQYLSDALEECVIS